MTEQIEIEYKTLLTHTQFAVIKAKYAPEKKSLCAGKLLF